MTKTWIDELLKELEDDHVGIWSIIADVAQEMPGEPEFEIREAALDLLYDLMRDDKIQAGFPDSNGKDFHPWPFEFELIMDKLEHDWKPEGPRPNVGELVWFTKKETA